MIERTIGAIPLGLSIPQNRQYRDDISSKQLDASKTISLPDEAQLEEFKTKHLPSTGDYYFVKLQGSLGWLSHSGGNQMILGTNKVEDINKEPLLKWCFQIFEEAICRQEVKLFVLGYSFRDKHVNDLILKAVTEYKISIYVISPEDPEVLRDRLEGKKLAGASYEILPTLKIWEAVRGGYYPYRLNEIFPANQVETAVAQDIKKAMK